MASQEARDTSSSAVQGTLAGEPYAHVKVFVPDTDELTVVVPCSGTIVAHAHGHQWKSGRHFEWWKGQSFDKTSAMHQADVLLAGYLHHEIRRHRRTEDVHPGAGHGVGVDVVATPHRLTWCARPDGHGDQGRRSPDQGGGPMMHLADLESVEAPTAVDWSVLAEPLLDSVAKAVARGFARDYGLTLEYDDALQEAVLVCAERSADVRRILSESGPGLLHRWLSQRLRNRWLTEARHRSTHTSYEAAQQASGKAER
ncbi:hypothetical protein [Streptomyces sp. NPDC001389]|uniref:hypothetical protein n=1 Tax=Streptomyces sp. NPDC001389 TaxID=3364569 RepID=UPI0036B0F2E9